MKSKFLLVAISLIAFKPIYSQETASYSGNNDSRDGDKSVFSGKSAGQSTTDNADYNTFIGWEAGRYLTSTDNNVFVGARAGYRMSGSQNVFIGRLAAGFSHGSNQSNSNNAIIGYMAGYELTTGPSNSILGARAGYNISSGGYNAIIGSNAAYQITTGYSNVYVGSGSGYNSTSALGNVSIGRDAGYVLTDGEYNVMIGYNAGRNASGDNNVFLGKNAGYNETGSNKLYVENTSTSDPLILGDFSTNDLTFNGNVTIPIVTSGSDGLQPNNTYSNIVVANSTGQLFYRDASTIGSTFDFSADHTYTGTPTFNDYIIFGNEEVPPTPIEGMLYYDRNVSWDTNNGFNQHFTGNDGGAIAHYNPEDGWGALISTANMQWITARFDNIYTHEVNVAPSNQWPDFVFNNDYDLKSLEYIESYIKENSHLPEIPSAKEVEENGVMLGEMNSLLLQKIEELTLHLINQNKQIKNLNERIIELEKQ